MLGPACEDLDAGRSDLSPLPIGHEVPQQRQIDEVAKAVVLPDLERLSARVELLGDLPAHGDAGHCVGPAETKVIE